jgi:predicted nucleic acid-binding protein
MRLIVDASVLVGELLRVRGRQRLADERLELFIPEQIWRETRHEVPRRIAALTTHRGLSDKEALLLTEQCFEAIDANVTVIVEAAYSPLQDQALDRCVRDPNDWPLVATALALDAAIWTEDNDLLGTGVATWTTATIQIWLDNTTRK